MPKISTNSTNFVNSATDDIRRGPRPKGHSLRSTVWVIKQGKGPEVDRLAKLPRMEADQLVSSGKAKFMKRQVVKRLLKGES